MTFQFGDTTLVEKKLFPIKIRGNSFAFDGWCLLCKTPAVVSQHVWTQSSTVQVVDLGNILMEPTTKFVGHDYHVFREINLNGGTEKLSSNDTLHPTALYGEISSRPN